MLRQQAKMRFVDSNIQIYYDNLYNKLSAGFQSRVAHFFLRKHCQERSMATVFNETTNYDLILASNICQPHLETRAANV